MSASVLPNEILHHIFRYLRGGDILECRTVCRRWEEAVAGLRDEFWKEMCAKEHISEVYEDAYRKANLSWRELYRSLSLWSDLANAEVNIHNISEGNVSNFQTLSDGVLAVSCRRQRVYNTMRLSRNGLEPSGYDTIVYYDLPTLTERRRECFDLMFKRFEENEFFYILEQEGQNSKENYVHIILKSNRKCLDFGKDIRGIWNWVLHENMVYLQCFQMSNHFCRIKIVEQNNDAILETEHIKYAEYYCRIRAIVNINSEQTNIFESEGRIHKSAQIYSLIGKEMKLLTHVNTRDDESQQTIKSYGFNLRCLPIFELFSRYSFANDDMMPERVFYHYAKTVIIHKREHYRNSFDLFYIPHDNPYETSGKLNLSKVKPTKSISLGIQRSNNQDFDLELIDVVETSNSHRLIVSFHNKIFVIELNHDASEKRSISEESVDFYKTIFNTQNRLIYTTYDYHTASHTNYAIDE